MVTSNLQPFLGIWVGIWKLIVHIAHLFVVYTNFMIYNPALFLFVSTIGILLGFMISLFTILLIYRKGFTNKERSISISLPTYEDTVAVVEYAMIRKRIGFLWDLWNGRSELLG